MQYQLLVSDYPNILYHPVVSQVLSMISELLKCHCSPFLKLKHLLLLTKCKDMTIPSDVRDYLLGQSPNATVVMKPLKVYTLFVLYTLSLRPLVAGSRATFIDHKITKTVSYDNI